MFSQTRKLYGNCLYWLNTLHWKIFHIALKNRACREIFHWIEYIFLSLRIFEQLALALKTEFVLKVFTALSILLSFGFLSNLRLPWKTECALNSLYSLYVFYHSGFLSNLRLPWKTEFPWKFSIYWNIFIVEDFWATCACPESRVYPEFTVLNIYLLPFRISEQLALALKNTSCPEIFHFIKIFFIIQDFWASCACPENRVCPEFTVLNTYFFILQGFWATCACPENRVCPENFQNRGGGRPPPHTPMGIARAMDATLTGAQKLLSKN